MLEKQPLPVSGQPEKRQQRPLSSILACRPPARPIQASAPDKPGPRDLRHEHEKYWGPSEALQCQRGSST
jgi:hypothetical protein